MRAKKLNNFLAPLFLSLGLVGFLVLAFALPASAQQAQNQSIPSTEQLLEICRPLAAGDVEVPGVFLTPLPDPLFEIPLADQISTVWLPLLWLLYLVNFFWAIPFANFLRFLQWLFLEPFRTLFGRKRAGFGVVYESLSKKPVDLALVRLIDAKTEKVVATRVTNRQGQFSIIPQPGRYRLVAQKQKHVFPSQFLIGETYDVNYGRVTDGSSFDHKEPGTLEWNLPVDAPEDKISYSAALRRRTRKALQVVFAYLGILLSAASLVVLWNVPALIFFVLHVLMFFLFFRLTDQYFGQPWGRVLDAITKNDLGKAVVRIVDSKYKRVLETRVTDNFGVYGFLVGQNEYYLESYMDGYKSYRGKPFKIKSRPGIVGQNLAMEPGVSPHAGDLDV